MPAEFSFRLGIVGIARGTANGDTKGRKAHTLVNAVIPTGAVRVGRSIVILTSIPEYLRVYRQNGPTRTAGWPTAQHREVTITDASNISEVDILSA